MDKVYLMRFGTVNSIIGLRGDVLQDSKIAWLFEKENPFYINKGYCFGRHYKDELEVTLIADSDQAEAVRELLDTELTDDVVQLQWNYGKPTARIIAASEYPQTMPLKSALRFTCESIFTVPAPAINAQAWLDRSVTTITEIDIRM